jgi:micrococcal nuclease
MILMKNNYVRRSVIAGAIVIVVVGVFVVRAFFFTNGAGHFTRSGADSTAWKFADLVRDNVLYPVVRDIDGDTVVVDVDRHDVTVRLIGADTPETVDPRKPVQCYGPEASAEAKKIFGIRSGSATTTGVLVYLDKDPLKGNYDKYGRLLAYVRLMDGSLYNEYMIAQGFAHEYTYSNEPYKYQAQFKADEKAAKKARLGLWGKCVAGI